MSELDAIWSFSAFLSAFLIGLSFGSGPCNLTCLPYLGPVLLGPSSERALGTVVLPFMSGRLTGYILIGMSAALLGAFIESYLKHPALPIVVGSITLWLAFRMLFKHETTNCAITPKETFATANTSAAKTTLYHSRTNNTDLLIATDRPALAQKHPTQLFLLGASLAANPCIPLMTLLAAAAQNGDPLFGGLLALAFGMGAVLIPSLLVQFGVALVGQELRHHLNHWKTTLTRIGGLLLIAVAISTMIRGIPG
ncbi:sulfite exporter TauE/SafE family protein [Neptunomonas concharum]|uniref:sulfite exporter TauE/SafE family protein n=1 Tax=Neptunomonas concharum TaxID=1031538 RepID=UPI001FECC0EC|nr:sulfite exporter TauE/SafE family protein [Neptunomonas concharum]